MVPAATYDPYAQGPHARGGADDRFHAASTGGLPPPVTASPPRRRHHERARRQPAAAWRFMPQTPCGVCGWAAGITVLVGGTVTALYLGIMKSGLIQDPKYLDGDVTRQDLSWRTPNPYTLTTLPQGGWAPFEANPGIVDIAQADFGNGVVTTIYVPQNRATKYSLEETVEALALTPMGLIASSMDLSLMARMPEDKQLRHAVAMTQMLPSGDIHVAVTPRANGMDIGTLAGILVHEGAHAFRDKLFPRDDDPIWSRYKAVIGQDKKLPSRYSEKSPNEHFAEASVLYFAAQRSPEKMRRFRADMPQASALLDEIYAGVDLSPLTKDMLDACARGAAECPRA
jgi:hypothetical protein